jgi:hypothetical protein
LSRTLNERNGAQKQRIRYGAVTELARVEPANEELAVVGHVLGIHLSKHPGTYLRYSLEIPGSDTSNVALNTRTLLVSFDGLHELV